MKKFISKALLVSTILSAPALTFAQADIAGGIDSGEAISVKISDVNKDVSYPFDEFGMRTESVKLGSKLGSAVQFEEAFDVKVDKEWTISFTGEPTYDNIYSMTVENVEEREFVSVRITLSEDNTATVTPTEEYEENTKYVVKIALEDGKRYEKHFTTGVSEVDNSETDVDETEYTESKYFTVQGGKITGYSVNGPTNVVIPREIDGQAITVLGRGAFANRSLSKVVIPNTVTTIESGTSVANGVFYNNGLTEIVIPDSVTTIGDYAFRKNKSLSGVKLSNNINIINKGVFEDCNLTEVIIPTGVRSIGEEAFKNNSLTGLNIPENVASINQGAFYNNLISELIIPDNVKVINAGGITSGVFAKNQISKLIISKNMTNIGTYTFYENPINNIVIPDNIKAIDKNAFKNKATDKKEITVEVIINGEATVIPGAFNNNVIIKRIK